jgi:hypothetical protein
LSAIARERSDIAQAATESLRGVDIDHPALNRDLVDVLLGAIESEANAEVASNSPARDNPEALDDHLLNGVGDRNRLLRTSLNPAHLRSVPKDR